MDCNSESVSEGHVPGETGQGANTRDSGAIASIYNAAMAADTWQALRFSLLQSTTTNQDAL